MTMGKGAIISNSNKQKLNVGSSTESELVATHDQMPDVMHTLYFIEAQGYAIDKNIIYQDNQSTIRLEVNGKMSSGKKTKHISSRFFFITDKVARGEVDVEYCPTEKMWCDILNKPKQGASYRLDRSHLMNVPIEYDDDVERRLTHPALLDKGDDDDVIIPPLDQKPPTAVPEPVRRSVLRDSLKKVTWDPRVVPRKTESGRFGRDSAKQVNIPRGRAARAIGSRLVRRARISPT